MGLWVMREARACDTRCHGSCPDIVKEYGGWSVKGVYRPGYSAGSRKTLLKRRMNEMKPCIPEGSSAM